MMDLTAKPERKDAVMIHAMNGIFFIEEDLWFNAVISFTPLLTALVVLNYEHGIFFQVGIGK